MTDLQKYPPHEKWHDWTELDAKAWPDKVERNYTLVPTTCFNCEAACGLLAYFDNETGEIAKIEGNPEHPASRGRNCAKGPATINQIYDNERIMYPAQADRRARQRRVGAHQLGSGADGDRWTHPHCLRRRPSQRGDVPRRPARRRRLRRPRAKGVGHRRTQQPHQHLLVERTHWLPELDGPRPPVESTSRTPRSSSSSRRISKRATTSTRTRSESSRPRAMARPSSVSTRG